MIITVLNPGPRVYWASVPPLSYPCNLQDYFKLFGSLIL